MLGDDEHASTSSTTMTTELPPSSSSMSWHARLYATKNAYAATLAVGWRRNVDNKTLAAGALAVAFFGVLFAIGFPFLWLICIIASAISGFAFCRSVLERPDLFTVFYKWLAVRLGISPNELNTLNIYALGSSMKSFNKSCMNDKKLNEDERTNSPAMSSMRVSKPINDALEQFFEALIDNYINNWYKTTISVDESFLIEVRHQIHHAAKVILHKLHSVDTMELCIDSILPAIIAHIERIAHLLADERVTASMPYFGESAILEENLLTRIANKHNDLHWAISDDGANSECDYLRVVADSLVAHCVDATQIGGRAVDADLRFSVGQPRSTSLRLWWPSHSCRHFLRELLLHVVLLPTLDIITDPDMLNRVVLRALIGVNEEYGDGGKKVENNFVDDTKSVEKVEFLGGFTAACQSQTPDSLLSLKLNELVREPRLIQLFDMYLRDIQGPTHMLDCFLQARDIHKRVQCYRTEFNNTQNILIDDDKRKQQQHDQLSEICSDAWQLFSAFVHTSAPNRIDFSASVRDDFAHAVQSSANALNDVALLEKATEDVYKEIYHKLYYDYVIPFCQSESYLGYLCGAPPDVEELLVRERDSTRSACGLQGSLRPATPSTFSLAQFRNKLFSVIGGGSASTPPAPAKSATSSMAEEAPYPTTSGGGGGKFSSVNYMDDLETGEIALVDLGRDLNKWTVAIPSVECRGEAVSTKTYFVYAIEVERYDLNGYSPKQSVESLDFGASRRSDLALFAINEKTRVLPTRLAAASTTTNQEAAIDAPRRGSNEALLSSESIKAASSQSLIDTGGGVVYETPAETAIDAVGGEILPTRWTTYRRYDEFFQLEEKITEFHGNSLRFTSLPNRKIFSASRPNRSLFEAHRPLFERFLQSLTKQSILKRSELLYDFLTLDEEEWGAEMALAATIGFSFFMPDLRNPIRAMRRMPTKLSRERGQNLKPFILNVLANILVPRGAVYSMTNCIPHYSQTQNSTTTSASDNGSVDTLSSRVKATLASFKFKRASNTSLAADGGEATHSCFKTIESRDVASARNASALSPLQLDSSANELDDKNTGISGLITFVLLRVVRLSKWLEATLLGVFWLFWPVAEPMARRVARCLWIEHVIGEQTILAGINALHNVLFDGASSSSAYSTPSAEERRLRADVALHRLEEALLLRLSTLAPTLSRIATLIWGNTPTTTADFRAMLRRVFAVFQHPVLNRQLVFVIIDQMTRHFIDEEVDINNPQISS